MMHNEPSTPPLRDRRPAPQPTLARPAAALVQSPRADDLSPARALGGPQRLGQPFRDAEACIFWTIRALAAEVAPSPAAANRRAIRRRPVASICTPAEVVKCLDKLYRRRRIDLHHVRILRIWGHRGRAPNPELGKERGDWRVWREALERLDWPLRSLGIISCHFDD
ncbi:hypothetical protein ACELLULO517_04070 [Acidisoma cellulosilytica]|uniref:Uncharacterized protein n=1 Tax=Acidisoma cellulosilyticum TaxID=2802395 RepID=A0A963YY80_9PROT|nr:hypothetical protein [Acidisoma cellulosilyticum]MCB8879397.1 hypothetical protein [Acidisoma cellulosilyticum]